MAAAGWRPALTATFAGALLKGAIFDGASLVKADLTEISAGNGYTAGGTATTITHSRSSGTSKIVGTDVVFTAGPRGA